MKLRNLFLIPASLLFLTSCVFDGGSKTYGFGDVVKVGDIEYTALSARNTKSIGSEYLGETTSNNFVIVNLRVRNVGNKELSLFSSMMIYTIRNSEYEPHTAGIYLDNGFYVIMSIGSGISKTIDVVYEIPSNYSESDYLSVKASSYSSSTKKIYMRRIQPNQ